MKPVLLYRLCNLAIIGLIVVSCSKDDDIIPYSEVDTWKYYSKSNGLSDNYIHAIKQDQAGNIWVGTNNGGVDMFDGSSWMQYDTYDGLLSNCILDIEQDNNGAMWFATIEGISILYHSIFYYIDSLNDIPFIPISLCNDSRNRMWIGTFGQGIFLDDGQQIKNYLPTDTNQMYINYIMEDKVGNIWFATQGGIIQYNDLRFKSYNISGDTGVFATWILEDSWGDLWFSFWDSRYLVRFNGTDTENIGLFNGYPVSYVWSIVEDFNRNIWFTTGGYGVVRYNGVEMESFKKSNGLKDDRVLCSALDRYGNIWFGTYNGGINVYISK